MKSTVLKFNGELKASCKRVIADAIRFNSGCGRGKESGPFKEWGTAKQAQYFHKKDKELIENLRKQMKDIMGLHKKQIETHQAAIKELENKQKDSKL